MSERMYPHPHTCNGGGGLVPPLMSGRSPPIGGGWLHHRTVAIKLQQFQHNLNFFGAFGAKYSLCLFCQSDGPPQWGGGGLGITRGAGGLGLNEASRMHVHLGAQPKSAHVARHVRYDPSSSNQSTIEHEAGSSAGVGTVKPSGNASTPVRKVRDANDWD